jgi:hypothetical protein
MQVGMIRSGRMGSYIVQNSKAVQECVLHDALRFPFGGRLEKPFGESGEHR